MTRRRPPPTWWDLLYVPLGLGLLSMPFVVGLAILRGAGRSDARLTMLRKNALPHAEAEKASDFLRTLSTTD